MLTQDCKNMRVDAQQMDLSADIHGCIASTKNKVSDAIMEIVKGCDQKDRIVDAQTCQIGKLRVILLLKGLSDIKFPRNNVLKNWLAGSIPARDQQIKLRSGATAARVAHNHEVGGSNPLSAIKNMVALKKTINQNPHNFIICIGNHLNLILCVTLYLALCEHEPLLSTGAVCD